ncbi:MAG: hypothetical protein HC906_09950 [Bacteroidales bacterium]|nr:hypothetical protein [Bacteroidales bacterium]
MMKTKKEFERNKKHLMKTGFHKIISHKNLIVGERTEINEEYSGYPSKATIIDGFYGIDRSKKTIQNDFSIFVYEEVIHCVKHQFFSPEIKKDSATLSFLLEKQGYIDLYVDHENFENYCFDLDFLRK